MNTVLAPHDARLLRFSLVAVWLGTAAVSAQQWQGLSLELLLRMGMQPGYAADGVIGAGVAADVAVGVLLLAHPRRWVFGLAGLATLVMTLVATVGVPDLWLHPIGPLLKNLPILAILWLLGRSET